MLCFDETAGTVSAHNAQLAFASVDDAFGASLRLTADLIDTFKGSGLAGGQSQKVYEDLQSSSALILQGRRALVSATGKLLAFQGQSNLQVVDYGCPYGLKDAKPQRQPSAPVEVRA